MKFHSFPFFCFFVLLDHGSFDQRKIVASAFESFITRRTWVPISSTEQLLSNFTSKKCKVWLVLKR